MATVPVHQHFLKSFLDHADENHRILQLRVSHAALNPAELVTRENVQKGKDVHFSLLRPMFCSITADHSMEK